MEHEFSGLDVAVAEVQRLRRLITSEPTIERLSYSSGQPLEMALRHPMVLSLVRALRDTMHSTDGVAPNYVEARVLDTEVDPAAEYVVTIQRSDGKTPHELRREAEARAAANLREGYLMALEDLREYSSNADDTIDDLIDEIESRAPQLKAP